MEHSEALSQKPFVSALLKKEVLFKDASFALAAVINLIIIWFFTATPSKLLTGDILPPPHVEDHISFLLLFLGLLQIGVSTVNLIIIYHFCGLQTQQQRLKQVCCSTHNSMVLFLFIFIVFFF